MEMVCDVCKIDKSLNDYYHSNGYYRKECKVCFKLKYSNSKNTSNSCVIESKSKEPMLEKECLMCKEVKKKEEFYLLKGKTISSYCKECFLTKYCKEKMICECGLEITKNYYPKHTKSKVHNTILRNRDPK